MTRFEHVTGPQMGDWEEALRSVESSPLHRPEVLSLDFEPQDLVYLLLRHGGEPVACALGVRAGGRVAKFLRRRELYLPTVPAIRAGAPVADEIVFQALMNFCREAGFGKIVIDARWGRDFSDLEPFASGIVRRSLEFELRVDRSGDEILAGMDRYHRKNVRRAERGGVSVAIDTSLEALLALRELQVSSSKRGEEKGNPFRIRGLEYFHRAHDLVYSAGLGEVAFARVDGETVAGLAYLRTESRAITVRSGATRLGYERNAMYLLQHEVLVRLGQEGVRMVNLGAVPFEASQPDHPQHGLHAFKKGFGGTPCVRTAVELQISRTREEMTLNA